MSEQDIIRQAQKGDIPKFHELFQKYRVYAYRTAFLITRDHHLAEDVTQEAFVKTYLHLGRYRSELPFKPWFTRIVLNTCQTLLKHRSRISVVPDPPERMTEELGYESVDVRVDLWKAMARLPLPIREVVVLRYYHDLTEAEIATILEVPPGTVKSRLHRAREFLEGTELRGKEGWCDVSER